MPGPDELDFEIYLSMNYLKFAVENDWNTKVFELCMKVGLFLEKVGFLGKKHMIFFNISKGGKFIVAFV